MTVSQARIWGYGKNIAEKQYIAYHYVPCLLA